jgi:hypothetical protein
MSRICPRCEEYGDVWEVSFTDLNDRRGVMYFECDTVWDSLCDDQIPFFCPAFGVQLVRSVIGTPLANRSCSATSAKLAPSWC